MAYRPRLRRAKRHVPVVRTRRPARAAEPGVVLTEERLSTGAAVAAAWRDKRILPWLSARLVVKGFAGTKLGRGWLVLRPAADLGGKAILFGAVINVPTNGVPYFLFLLASMQCWRLFQNAVTWGTRCTQYYRRHARALNFSLLLMPVAGSAPALVEFVIYGIVLAGAFAYFLLVDGQNWLQLGPQLLYSVAAVALTFLLAWGLSFWLAVWNAYARDVKATLRYVLEVWLFITPVLYPLTLLPDALRWLAIANPMAPIIEMFRFGLIGEGDVRPVAVAVSTATIGVLVVSGAWYYNRQILPALDALEGVVDDEEDELL